MYIKPRSCECCLVVTWVKKPDRESRGWDGRCKALGEGSSPRSVPRHRAAERVSQGFTLLFSKRSLPLAAGDRGMALQGCPSDPGWWVDGSVLASRNVPGDHCGSDGPTARWSRCRPSRQSQPSRRSQPSPARSSHSCLCQASLENTSLFDPLTDYLALKAYRFGYPPHYRNKIGCKHYCLGYLLLHDILKLFEATVYKISAPNCPAFVISKLPGTAVMQYLLHVHFPHPHIYFTCVCNPLYEETCCHAMEKVYFFHMGCTDSVKPLV